MSFTEAWLRGPSDTAFYTRVYAPPTAPKAAIVFIHGFAEHIARYAHFHPLLCSHGISVFTFDQRGFGLTALDISGQKSPTSSYGKTSWTDQAGDIAWAIKHVETIFPDVPIFLMGHSMGGAEVLGFTTLDKESPYGVTLASISGIIATSPLIQQSIPASKWLRWAGRKASHVFPWLVIPAEVDVACLSHDPAVADDNKNDPLCKQLGTLRGLDQMLTLGDMLLLSCYKNWPENLPLLIMHGTDDKITSCIASQEFCNKISAEDKTISLYKDGYHELHNEPDGVKERVSQEIGSFIARIVSQTHSTEEKKIMKHKTKL